VRLALDTISSSGSSEGISVTVLTRARIPLTKTRRFGKRAGGGGMTVFMSNHIRAGRRRLTQGPGLQSKRLRRGAELSPDR
jgi:hypothetical protein